MFFSRLSLFISTSPSFFLPLFYIVSLAWHTLLLVLSHSFCCLLSQKQPSQCLPNFFFFSLIKLFYRSLPSSSSNRNHQEMVFSSFSFRLILFPFSYFSMSVAVLPNVSVWQLKNQPRNQSSHRLSFYSFIHSPLLLLYFFFFFVFHCLSFSSFLRTPVKKKKNSFFSRNSISAKLCVLIGRTKLVITIFLLMNFKVTFCFFLKFRE